jgi:transposase-like protein
MSRAARKKTNMTTAYHTPSDVDQIPVSLPRADQRRSLREAQKIDATELEQLARDGLLAFGVDLGLACLAQMMEEDADLLCGGPKGQHNPDRQANRHGTVRGQIIVGGRRVSVERPRVRAVDGSGELDLPSYQAVQNPEFLTDPVMVALMAGVSQRRYQNVLEEMTDLRKGLKVRGLSRSAVGRRFIAGTSKLLAQLQARPLDDTRYLVLYLDGVHEQGHCVIVAVGLTESGQKRTLGLRQGSTENAELCREFLEDLVARGLSVEHGLLVVIDGGKGIAAAIRQVWGERVLIQRCRCHKKRNVLDQVPEKEREGLSRDLTAAWSLSGVDQSREALEKIATTLETNGHAAAASSLREGMEETLTCIRLSLDAELTKTLSNTNVVESTFSQHEAICHRVKRWRHGRQVLRWVAAALLQAERSYGRVGSTDSLKALAAALTRHAQEVRAKEVSLQVV